MTHRKTHVTMLAFALALGAASCSSSDTNSAPVIDKLDMPGTATKEGPSYAVTGTVSYHDDDGTVNTMRIYAPAGSKDPSLTINVPGGGGASGTAALKVLFNGTPGQSIDYEISVLDSLNLESARAKATVKIP